MHNLARVKEIIEKTIEQSNVPEDPIHSKNTLQWLLKLEPDADEALQIAALGHDIERALQGQKVKRQDFEDYEAFKRAHALNSAEILRRLLFESGVDDTELVESVFNLVRRHEVGGNSRSDMLKDADSLSYFDVNLPHYFKRNGWEETLRRCRWGYRRLSERARTMLTELHHDNKELCALLELCQEESE